VGLFAEYQPIYAALGIATFPVNPETKVPLVRNPQLFGIPGSGKLVAKFPDADCFGFWAGPFSRVSVIDLDSPDKTFLEEAIQRFGPPCLIVRTASRKGYHLYYRNAGEPRKIHLEGLPLDVLGRGLVIASPSRNSKGEYTIVTGSLEDLHGLSEIRPAALVAKSAAQDTYRDAEHVNEGGRDNALFNFCMRKAKLGKAKDIILRDARAYNAANLHPPLPDDIVIAKVEQAWKYQTTGKNFISDPYIKLLPDQVDRLAAKHSYALALLAILRRNHWSREFVIANAMAKSLGWPLSRLQKARRKLEVEGYVRKIRRHSRVSPAVYDWPS
jgi:hypothetical protein